MASGKRYKFNGSTFQVQTGFAATKTISAITKANPGVVSSPAHGLLLGAVGKIAAVVGMTELNGGLYVVDNPVTGTFELAGTDTTNYSTYTSGGTFAPVTFSSICELTGVNQQDDTADEIEVSTICSTAKEFEQGLSGSGTLQIDYNFAPNEAVQAAVRSAKLSGTAIAFKITLPNSGGNLVMFGTVQQSSFTGGVNGVWTGSSTIKLTGPIFVLAGA